MIHSLKIENNDLIVDIYEIAKYPVLNRIYTRDTSTTKEYAKKELLYVHFIADKTGYCFKNGLGKKESHIYAVEQAQLDLKYKPDNTVIAAINLVTNNLNLTVIEDLINNNIKGFNLSCKLVSTIVDKLQSVIDNENYTDDELDRAESNIKKLIKIGNELPDRIEELVKLRNEYDKIRDGVDVIRGGKEHSNSYDGDDFGTDTNSNGMYM